MTKDNKLAVHSTKNEEKQNKNEEIDNNYVNLNTNNSIDSYKDLINIGKSIKNRNNEDKNKLHLSRIKPKKITFRKMTYFNSKNEDIDIDISSNISNIDNKSEILNLTPIKEPKKVANDNEIKDKNLSKNKKKRKKNKKNIKNTKTTQKDKKDKKSNETLSKELEQKNKNKAKDKDNRNLDLKITNNKENNINNPENKEKNEIKGDNSNKNLNDNKNINNNKKKNGQIKSPIKNKEEEENEIIEKIEENLDDEDNEEEGKKNSEDIRNTLAKNQLDKSNKFIEERRFNSLNYLFSQKYKEHENNIEKETKEPNSPIKEVNINTIEDIEYKKNVLLYKMKEDIRSKIKEGKYDINELENFNKFEDNINQYHLNHGSKDVNQVKEYFLLLSKKFSEFQEIMNDKETRLIEEERINKFLANLNFELDYNIPEALLKKGRRCRSSNLYKRLITLSEITKKLNDLD